MSRSNAEDDILFDASKTHLRPLYPVITRDWAIRPARRSSPPLSDLFPEYYEPIEPEQASSSSEPADTTNISPKFDVAQPEKYITMPENLHHTGNDLQARELQSQRRPVFPSDGVDKDTIAVPPPEPPMTRRQPLSVKRGGPWPSAASKHHCLISGHVFEHYRLSRLPSGVEIDGLGPPSQHRTHKQEDLKVCCMICRARVREHLWKCVIPVCLREVCGDCRSRLERERVGGAKAGWKGGS